MSVASKLKAVVSTSALRALDRRSRQSKRSSLESMFAHSKPCLSFLTILSLIGCAHTPSETFTEPQPRETAWRIGDHAAGLPADTGLGFIALPVTQSAPNEAEPTEAEVAPAKTEPAAAEPLPVPSAPTTDAPTTDANATKHRSLTISLADQAFEYKEDESVVRSGPISSGRPGYPTPTGRFKVLGKDEAQGLLALHQPARDAGLDAVCDPVLRPLFPA
jgi:hypothetical protein